MTPILFFMVGMGLLWVVVSGKAAQLWNSLVTKPTAGTNPVTAVGH